MELNEILDYAIMADESSKNPNVKAGYEISDRTYGNYLSNDCFDEFAKVMETKYQTAFKMYELGKDNEMEVRKNRWGTCSPPKMASFGSSSRMIFNLMKDVEGFLFEKQLPTTVGGTANLDGFIETAEKCIFVEAKCREPYSAKDNVYERKYEELYNFISASVKSNIGCDIKDVKNEPKKMKVTFSVNDEPIHHFDMKQMISHLLGVATAFLKEEFDVKKIDIVYLLFNPKLIEINESKDKICQIYEQTCNECNSVDFNALFDVIVEYLQTVKKIGTTKNKLDIVNSFNFRLCDQQNMYV